MKTNRFVLAKQIIVLGFINSFRLARGANRIHEGAEMSAMPHSVADHVVSSLSRRMVQSDGNKSNNTAVNFNRATPQASNL